MSMGDAESGERIGLRVSFKQVLVLIDVMKASIQHCEGTFGGYPKRVREMVINQIINQQSDSLIELVPEDIIWSWEDLEDDPPQKLL